MIGEIKQKYQENFRLRVRKKQLEREKLGIKEENNDKMEVAIDDDAEMDEFDIKTETEAAQKEIPDWHAKYQLTDSSVFVDIVGMLIVYAEKFFTQTDREKVSFDLCLWLFLLILGLVGCTLEQVCVALFLYHSEDAYFYQRIFGNFRFK